MTRAQFGSIEQRRHEGFLTGHDGLLMTRTRASVRLQAAAKEHQHVKRLILFLAACVTGWWGYRKLRSDPRTADKVTELERHAQDAIDSATDKAQVIVDSASSKAREALDATANKTRQAVSPAEDKLVEHQP
jgi:hypothetical protein